MANDLKDFSQQYEKIKLDTSFQYGVAQEFVTELLSQSPEIRIGLLPLLKQIQQDSWEKGFSIVSLDLFILALSPDQIISKESKSVTAKLAAGPKKIEVDDFNSILYKFSNTYKNLLEGIKGYYLFKLDNGNKESTTTEVIFLCDEDFQRHPHIKGSVEHPNKNYLIQEFLDLIRKEPEKLNKNYLCLVLITPNLRSADSISQYLSDLFKVFPKSNYISLLEIPTKDSNDFRLPPYKDGLAIIEKYSTIIFNNRSLTFDEEKIIGKLFESKEIILDYKVLKAGNSGAKVIEVQFFKGHTPTKARYVIKFCKIDNDKKLELEKRAFNEFVRDLHFNEYQSEYETTDTHEGIRYTYASSDSVKDSYSFSDLIKMHSENKSPFLLSDGIKDLFISTPLKKWKETKESVDDTVANLYAKYLPSVDKIIKTISEIKGINEEETRKGRLITNLSQILNYKLSTFKKICHGDLHSENFYKDENGVYLIDFGWTGRRHALIDHAFLECSLKYNHVPRYISTDELILLENHFLTIESFSSTFDISFISRKKVKEIFSLITQIRENAKDFLFAKSNSLEYLISLFIVSLKLMRYTDLNQRYALDSAELLSMSIMNLRHKEGIKISSDNTSIQK